MPSYYPVQLDPTMILGEAGPLPPLLQGSLSDEALADLSWTDESHGMRGTGYWPEVVEVPPYDPATHRPTSGRDGEPQLEAEARVVHVVAALEPIPAEEIAAALAAKLAVPLTPLEFARRLTLEERIGIRASTDPVVVDFLWMLDRAAEVRLDDPDTIAGTRCLEQVGLLAAGRAEQILAPRA